MTKLLVVLIFLIGGMPYDVAFAQDYSLYTKVVQSLTIDGRRIARGMSHDEFLAKVGFNPISTTTAPDELMKGSLVVYKRYWESGQQFLVEFRRQQEGGPYVVYRIRLPSSN